MSKLKDVFQRALVQRSPSPAEARADLERILARTRRRRQVGWVALAAAAAIAGAIALQVSRGHDTGDLARAPAAAPDRSIRIYVRKADEPESDALSLSVDSQGDL